MMSTDRRAAFDIGHPAPGAAAVGAVWLWLSFLAAPAIWSLQLAAVGSIAGLACLEASGARDTSRYEWAAPVVQAINVVALALAIGALALSIVHLRRTRAAAPEPKGGVMAAGEGRAHFMAIWAVFTSALFIGAIAFNTFSVFWVGLCPV
jgi:hypothetical protein